MHYLVLGCDYDGTLAHDGAISDATVAALENFKKSGRKLTMVTGRELPDLKKICPRLDLFDCVVAENGAVLFNTGTQELKVLAKPPPPEFVKELIKRGVNPISVGEVIVATWEPHETTVLDCIRDLGLELQVIFNKHSVMVLPAGTNKATGFGAALSELKLSPHNAVGVGDAENDHAFLSICECAVAVANALPSLKAQADIVTHADHGAGVVELIDEILRDDLATRETLLKRHRVLLGNDLAGNPIEVAPQHFNGLLLGTSGSGKSSLTVGLLERLREKNYSFAVIDPEGDYGTLEGAMLLGTPSTVPEIPELIKVMEDPEASVVINLLAVSSDDRPKMFASLFGQLREMRARSGRPHCIVLDESHHLMPTHRETAAATLPVSLEGVLQITVNARTIEPTALRDVNTVIVTGEKPAAMLAEFAAIRGLAAPQIDSSPLAHGEAIVWRMANSGTPTRIRVPESRTERRRHIRKYAEGELPEDRSFYFRGPDSKLNLRAQNLMLFLQLADGVDAATWQYHLDKHDYSAWIRGSVKDDELAEEIDAVEKRGLDPAQSRKEIRAAVEAKYTLPAT